ncbi:cysteine--tRNA ligase, chloroplastic/mitochondrial isoform X2 [Prosopis cineraria]|uniref:cysteine--tRNA ligase, chloroplastic/mitochondrial isoform X2 n=1 Tax=Prosopis cineraria TaxID=364024 RepID=UPI00240EDF93|nr:cysteine--tRNA ligase, chloroplastic/mitochondrial isoform X2 [Prosopis cineraria]
MGTLLKCYRSFFLMLPYPARTIQFRTNQLGPAAIFRRKKLGSVTRCFSARSLRSYQPSLTEQSAGKFDGERGRSPSPELWLYNTMSKGKELFKPKVEGKVGMYVCGVTAYDLSHIGHARVYINFDVLYRYLKHMEFEVCYVRNFTDVDDKIIARAKELGEDPISLSRRYCEEFSEDMATLHCLPPSVEPRVSEHMPHIVDMIEQIIKNGYAYIVDGDVYFDVEKFPEYGQLSGRDLQDNRAGERVAVDSRKKNPADFALWKSAKPGEPFWESPWGPGRPGWHIECSAMSAAHLGYSFDIHGGGIDLVFPHHENEIAQSCAACKKSNVSLWMHNGFVTVDSEKMSKSLGNFFTIRQTLYECESFLCQHDLTNMKDSIPPDILDIINKFHDAFVASMSDDLHTPVILAALSDPLKAINDLLLTRKGRKRELRIESLSALEKHIRTVLTVLGLMPASYSEVLQQLNEKALKRANLTKEQVSQKIEERAAARMNKEYEKSDAIRNDLAVLGIALKDSPNGTTWRPTIPLSLQEQQTNAP